MTPHAAAEAATSGLLLSPQDELQQVLAAIDSESHDAEDLAQSFCQSCIESQDRQRWRFGDVAAALKDRARYGDRAVNEIARISRVGKSTAHQYAQMAKFYPVDIRDRWKDTQIGWTSMKHAMRLGSTEDAVNFLDKAAAEGWTADQVKDRTNKKQTTTGIILECTGILKAALLPNENPKPKETGMLHIEIPATADVSQVHWLLGWQKETGKKRKLSIRITAEVLPDAR